MDVHDVYRYMSGSLGGGNNYPTIYADLEKNRLIVTGRAGYKVFEDGDVEAALKGYESLLRECGYVDETQDADPDEIVIVAWEQIFPSNEEARATLGDEEFGVLYKEVSPVGPGFGFFSGNRTGDHDFPTIYAWSYPDRKLVVMGRGYEEEFALRDAAKAFAAFSRLLETRGFEEKKSADVEPE
jgi:hypothetical protein